VVFFLNFVFCVYMFVVFVVVRQFGWLVTSRLAGKTVFEVKCGVGH